MRNKDNRVCNKTQIWPTRQKKNPHAKCSAKINKGAGLPRAAWSSRHSSFDISGVSHFQRVLPHMIPTQFKIYYLIWIFIHWKGNYVSKRQLCIQKAMQEVRLCLISLRWGSWKVGTKDAAEFCSKTNRIKVCALELGAGTAQTLKTLLNLWNKAAINISHLASRY